MVLKNYFMILLAIIKTLNLSPNTIAYYAAWVKKAKLSQLKQFPQQNKIDLYVIAFMQHQFYIRQDAFVDILIKSVQSIKNTAIRNLNEIEQSTRTDKRNAVQYILKSHKTSRSLIDEITTIAKSSELTDSGKVQKVTALLDEYAKEKSEKEMKKAEIFENSLERISKNNDYFATLEKLSVKLQNRVASIIQVLLFNEDNSDPNILKAIKYFVEKKGNIDSKAPVVFLKKDEREALTINGGQFRISLYKILLFLHIVDAIKSGKLNLKYSYRYLAIQDYLIDNTNWIKLRDELLKVSNLESFANYEKTISQLKQKLEGKYQQVNHSFLGQRDPYLTITQENKVQITTPPLEEKETKYIAALVSQAGYIPIFQVLYELNKITKYTQSFKNHSIKYNKRRPNPEVFIAGMIGLGCNIGIPKIAQISTGINGNTLSNIVNWYFSRKTLMAANDNILALIKRLSLSNLFVEDALNMHGASDGCKVAVNTESLLANFSFKYFGHVKGISIYTFIDEQQALFHGLVMSASEREAHYVIDGLLENDVPRVKIHSTDTHRYSELIFATTYFMEVSFAPRIKRLGEQHIYSFVNKKTYERQGLKILPTRTINLALIKQYWEDILRFMVTIRLKKVTASQLFKRLSSYAKDNPLYKAIKEFGRIIKSIFILSYYSDVKFRQRIEKHLNGIELANKFGHAVFYANEQEFKQAIPEEQEVVVLCRIFIQNSIILWNYLYLSQLLANCFNEEERSRMLNLMKDGSILTWRHINLHGEFNFRPPNINNNVFDINKILSLKLTKVAA